MKYTKLTTLGYITIEETDGFITRLEYTTENELKENKGISPLLKQAFLELDEYLSKKRKSFSIPLKQDQTAFSKKVLDIVSEIPYGKTKSYNEIAILLGDKNKRRAVGRACHNNKLPIFIPCHRVVGSTNNLTGYNGGIDKKIKLLELEK